MTKLRLGEQGARDQVDQTKESISAIKLRPELVREIIENGSKENRLKMAEAIEAGDAYAYGKAEENILSAFIGGLGKAGKIAGKGVKLAEISAKVKPEAGVLRHQADSAISPAPVTSNGEANSVSGLKLREELASQAGIPRGLDSVWGANLDDLKKTYKMDGFSVSDKPPRGGTSGNAQIFTVKGNSVVKEVQFSPSTERLPLLDQSKHVGKYYKFTYNDGSKVKVIDPATYKTTGWPEGNTTFYNQTGNQILFNPVTKTWTKQ